LPLGRRVCYSNPYPRSPGWLMKSSHFLVAAACTLNAVIGAAGCRAIGRLGDSRQSISARRLSGQGFQAMHDGQWEIAEDLFSDALEVSKADDRAHWGLAEAYWKRGDLELAVAQMEQAVRLSAGDPKFVQRLGRMYLELGRLQEAESHSLWALESQRDSAETWGLRGDCLKATGELDDALAAYHRALALQPDYAEVQLQAAKIYLSQRRYDRLLATLGRLQDGVGVDDAPPQVDLLQGIAMRELGRDEEARRCFARACNKDATDATPHLQMAELALARGEVVAARTSLEIASMLDPESSQESVWMQQLRDQQARVARELPMVGLGSERR
jgi:tetratricopeptide (TPR) repeat protein